jgi:sulfate transport system permease protein
VAVVMLVISFVLLLLINLLQAWTRRHQSGVRAAALPDGNPEVN